MNNCIYLVYEECRYNLILRGIFKNIEYAENSKKQLEKIYFGKFYIITILTDLFESEVNNEI